jgi:serine/threonine protein phosphatase PrpC
MTTIEQLNVFDFEAIVDPHNIHKNESVSATAATTAADVLIPIIGEEPPTVIEESPTVIEESPAVIEEPPAVIEESPAVIEEPPAVIEEPPAVIEESPAVIDIKPRSRKMTYSIKQLDSCQDSVFTGYYIPSAEEIPFYEPFDWGIIADGHGKAFTLSGRREPFMGFKKAFDALDHEKIVFSEDPVAYIQQMIPFHLYPANVGATFLMFKAFKNRIEIYSIGDSSARVFVNKELVYANELHTIGSEKEVKRLAERNIKYNIVPNKSPRILDETHLIMEDSDTVTFYNRNYNFGLSLTQSIGHHSMTGFDPERKTIEFDDEAEVQIVIASDGVFDVVCNEMDGPFLANVEEADELVDFAEARWKQQWWNSITQERRNAYMKNPKNREKIGTLVEFQGADGKVYYEYESTTFPDYDDISCVVWTQR